MRELGQCRLLFPPFAGSDVCANATAALAPWEACCIYRKRKVHVQLLITIRPEEIVQRTEKLRASDHRRVRVAVSTRPLRAWRPQFANALMVDDANASWPREACLERRICRGVRYEKQGGGICTCGTKLVSILAKCHVDPCSQKITSIIPDGRRHTLGKRPAVIITICGDTGICGRDRKGPEKLQPKMSGIICGY